MSYLCYLCLFTYSGVQPIVLCLFCFSSSCVPYFTTFSVLSLRLVFPISPLSLYCPFVLCSLFHHFLCIVPSSCVPYFTTFSVLSLRLVYPISPLSLYCPFGLCSLFHHFLCIVPSACVPYFTTFSVLSLRYSLTFIKCK
jgi:hypothetical protein